MSKICYIAILAILGLGLCQAITFQVEPQVEECLYYNLEEGADFKMNFEVIRGGLFDIQFRVYNPKNRVVYDKMAYFSRKDTDDLGDVQFKAGITGAYKICFDNTMSRWTAKVITANVDKSEERKEEIAKLEHLGPVVDSVIKISDDLEMIETLQRKLRSREMIGRSIAESANSQLQWLAIFQSIFLVVAAVFQLKYIRHWFAETEKAGRV